MERHRHLDKEVMVCQITGTFSSHIKRASIWNGCLRVEIMGILNLLVHFNVTLKLHACLCNIKGSWGYHVVAKGYI